ncbi:MAG: hypothetical protein GF350_00705 [Chitinivibrionales bacterium]|nr:hypothetical protein [Chitinivibrionales bacterium]
MIAKMREIAPTVILVALVGFVLTIFFSWGMDISGKQKKHVVGTIEGKEISWEQFDKEVNVERERQREMSGGELSPYQARMIPRQVWETLVSQAVLNEVFEKMKLGASAEEVFQHIRNNPPPGVVQNPYFMTDSVFDTTKFVNFLNDPEQVGQEGMQYLEAHVRNFLVPMEKLQQLITVGNMVTRAEIAHEYRAENERCVFEYAKVSSKSFAVDSSVVTGEMVQEYYNTNPDSFVEKEQAVVHFVEIPKKVTAEDEKVYYNELLDIKERMKSGDVSFAEEARIASDDEGSAKDGGDLGWFGRGSMVKEFDSVAFSLDSGDVSDPFKTSFGFHLVKVEGRRGAGDDVRIHARHILRKILPSVETLDSLQELADTMRVQMDSLGFNEVVAKYPGLSVDSAGPFTKGEMPVGIGYISGMSYFVFNGEEGDIAENPYENKEAFYIIKIGRKIPAGRMPLEMVEDMIFDSLYAAAGEDTARNYLSEILAEKPEILSVAQLSKLDSLVSSGTTDTVTCKEYVAGVGRENKVIAAAFALDTNTQSDIIEEAGTFYVVKPLWHDRVESIPWQSPRLASIVQKLLQANSQKLYYDWYLNKKEQADIEDNVGEYYYD